MIVVHAYIDVTNIQAGLDFYCDGLGLTLKRRLSPRWVELAGAILPVFLLGGRAAVADLGRIKLPRSYDRHVTPVHLDFVVDNLDEAVGQLLTRGASLDRPIGEREYEKIANMAGPFGNGFDLIEFSATGYDEVARDQ